MSHRNVRVTIRVAAWMLAAIVALLAGYIVAGTVGGMIPANRGWTPPSRGVRIYVESNGIHVGLVLPKVAAGVDWRPLAPARDLADPRYAALDHLAIGWGERSFYLETPTWADVKVRTVLASAIGSDRTLMHVEHVTAPPTGPDVREITLTPAQYRRLAAFVMASFKSGGGRHAGYDGYDVFYEASGHYSAARTCNAWTGEALRHAGVRVGRWTPFPATLMQWFPERRVSQ